jgi:hypothetical protein
MPKPARRPDPPPLRTNDQLVAIVGTAAWIVALVVLALFFRGPLADHGATWWLAACGVGAALGLYGIWFTRPR